MEWTADKVRKVQQIMYETDALSLNEIIEREVNEHGDDTSLINFLPADQISVEDEIIKNDGNKLLREFVKKLPPREQLVIRMRFGLDDEIPKTLEEVVFETTIAVVSLSIASTFGWISAGIVHFLITFNVFASMRCSI